MRPNISVCVGKADFDVGKEIAELSRGVNTFGAVGAVASFVGVVRASAATIPPVSANAEPQINSRESHGQREAVPDDVDVAAQPFALNLEHYPEMTESAIYEICLAANQRWPLQAVRVIHRVGGLQLGDQIVFVGVASAHRGEAFAACEFIMDYLKTQAPFWKKEADQNGARWVDAKDSDDLAAARWS